ncbi:MAG: right-handed parallel beta-helix repeat-containing protein, partial [Planctomycetota bacterium]
MQRTILVNLVVLLVTAGLAPAATRMVPDEYATIQAAIDDCVDGDEVVVLPGIYTGDGNRDIDFLGKAITVRSPNGPQSCVIDCRGAWRNEHRGFHVQNGEDANSIVDGITITGGYAEWGGGVLCADSSPTITNCIIYNNVAARISCGGGLGGGICCLHANPTISNCTIGDNRARGRNHDGDGFGGGIYCRSSNPTITNCTIIGNSAGEEGGGISSTGDASATITNCILWGNLRGDEPEQIRPYARVSVAHSAVQGGWPGEGNIDADPCLAFSNDCHLMPGSPCIDAGTNTPVGGLPVADIEGNPRPVDGDGDGNEVADIGADEYNPHGPSIAACKLHFHFTRGWPKPLPQRLLIRNSGSGALNWQIVEDCDWLEVSPTGGTSTGQINEVTLIVDSCGLPLGDHACALRVVDENASNTPV